MACTALVLCHYKCMANYCCKCNMDIYITSYTSLLWYIHLGVQGLSLSSKPVSDGSHITVCPHTSVILNCTATQVATLTWHDQNGQIALFAPTDIDTEALRVREVGPYTLTLVAVDNPVVFFCWLHLYIGGDGRWHRQWNEHHMSNIWKSRTHAHL